MDIHKIINLKANKPVYTIHFRPFNDSGNVRCLNGNAHASYTTDKNRITCPLCLNENTKKEFWFQHEQKHGNVHKNM